MKSVFESSFLSTRSLKLQCSLLNYGCKDTIFSIFPQLAGLILINRLWLPESRRRYPSHLLEELSEMRLRGEAEGIGYLLHSMGGGG